MWGNGRFGPATCAPLRANFFTANSLSWPEGPLPNLCNEDLGSSIAKPLPSAHPGALGLSDAVATKIYPTPIGTLFSSRDVAN